MEISKPLPPCSAWYAIILFAANIAAPYAACQQATTNSAPLAAPMPQVSFAVSELPDSPGATRLARSETISKSQETSGQPRSSGQTPDPITTSNPSGTPSNATASTETTPVENQSPQPQTAQPLPPLSQDAQPPNQKPAGTAAAESNHPSGVAASEPAGIAIAPAKQRRVRTVVLRVGAILGAGVAIGSVVALTEATPSKPPGAH
jgi:hypothetical protein